MNSRAQLACPCGVGQFASVFTYDSPPEGETRFTFSGNSAYSREIFRCEVCGHFISVHSMDDDSLYSQEYVQSTYGTDKLRATFDRIVALDPERSDNYYRVDRIRKFASSFLTSPEAENRLPSLLDVGSGLCVFPYAMKKAGWDCTTIDPDLRSVEHARETVGVTAYHGDFLTTRIRGLFDVVTFNKVLEHVREPERFLRRSVQNLHPGGFVYIELPDGELAAQDGPGREEFFIEHYHIFSAVSAAMLAVRAGFVVRTLERLREPSTKYTLRLFLTPSPAG